MHSDAPDRPWDREAGAVWAQVHGAEEASAAGRGPAGARAVVVPESPAERPAMAVSGEGRDAVGAAVGALAEVPAAGDVLSTRPSRLTTTRSTIWSNTATKSIAKCDSCPTG
jgi:hypothetical protein